MASPVVDAAISSAFEVIAGDPNNQVFVAALQGAHASAHPGSERCISSVNGIGTIAIEDPEATLHLTSVDEGCVTGELSGLEDPIFQDAPSFNGAFFAIRCP